MITNTLLSKKWFIKSYLLKNEYKSLQPVFPAANLAVRRQVIDEIGLFDTECNISGEDTDFCIRASKTKWEIFFESRAVVYHKHRSTLKGLLKQWYGYGMQHPFIFKKHAPPCLEICYPDKKSDVDWSAVRFTKIGSIPVGIHALIFITSFHVLNLILMAALATTLLGWHLFTKGLLTVWFLGWLYFSGEDFFRNVIIKRNPRWFVYFILRYILNWAYVIGAFLSGLKIGVFYLGATREKTPSGR